MQGHFRENPRFTYDDRRQWSHRTKRYIFEIKKLRENTTFFTKHSFLGAEANDSLLNQLKQEKDEFLQQIKEILEEEAESKLGLN